MRVCVILRASGMMLCELPPLHAYTLCFNHLDKNIVLFEDTPLVLLMIVLSKVDLICFKDETTTNQSKQLRSPVDVDTIIY